MSSLYYKESCIVAKLALLVILSVAAANGIPSVQVNLSPSPIVTVAFNSTVTFQCSVNDTSYHIHWSIAYFNTPLSTLDIQFNDDRTLLTILANMKELNESVISCGLQEEVNGPVTNVDSCTLLIQDHLLSIGDLSCNEHSRRCMWSAPYNLHGVYISHYTVTVTIMTALGNSSIEENDVFSNFTTTDQSWVYCPYDLDELMEYSDTVMEVTVVPVNTIGLQGPPVSATLKGISSITSISLNISQLYKISPNLFAVNFEFSEEQLLQYCVTSIRARISDIHTNTTSHNASQTDIVLPGTIHTEFIIHKKSIWNVTIELYLENSLLSSFDKRISSFDLQDLLITNPIYGRICFKCLFIANATAIGCLVKFEHSETNEENNLIIPRAKNESNVFDCVSNIVHGGHYLIWAYDINTNGSGQSDTGPAVTGKEVVVDGPTITDSSQIITPTSTQSSTSTTSTPNPDNGDKLFNVELFLYIIVPILFILICLILSFISVLLISWRCRSRKKKILKIVGKQLEAPMNQLRNSLDRNGSTTTNNRNTNNESNADENKDNHNNLQDNIDPSTNADNADANTVDSSDITTTGNNDDNRSDAADSGISSSRNTEMYGSRRSIAVSRQVVPAGHEIVKSYAKSLIEPSEIEETLV